MRRFASAIGALVVSASAWASASAQTPEHGVSPIPAESRQLLVVRTKTWHSLTGTLQLYERTGTASWRSVHEAAAVNVGRAGMAWGRGLQPPPETGPVKREGDGRAPAGVFAIGTAFGYAERLEPNTKNFPYMQVRDGVYCVEDARSPYYNQIVDQSEVALKGWERKSAMHRPDGLFRWGVVVRQNDDDTKRGAGSCIFMHIWRGLKRGTAGCTAMQPDHVERLLGWLDPKAEPVLVQLPEAEYERLRAAWQLP